MWRDDEDDDDDDDDDDEYISPSRSTPFNIEQLDYTKCVFFAHGFS